MSVSKLIPTDRRYTRKLTERQRQVAELVALGYRDREIAQSLGISLRTVRNYLDEIASKLLIDPSRNLRVQIAWFVWISEPRSTESDHV
jgi:DNA-binding NarL/FixJ family response regulator